MPKGVAPDLERRLSPHLLNQTIDVGADCLARDRKDPLVLPKLPHPQIALDPGLEVPIQDGNKPFGGPLQAALARPPCPLLERFKHDAKVVAVVDETGRRDREYLRDSRPRAPHEIQDQPVHGVRLAFEQVQHFGFEQVLGHDVEAFQEHRPLGN